ncbi:MAG: hypothetical protein NVSMB65_22270 [Chloroflexota bacterium]
MPESARAGRNGRRAGHASRAREPGAGAGTQSSEPSSGSSDGSAKAIPEPCQAGKLGEEALQPLVAIMEGAELGAIQPTRAPQEVELYPYLATGTLGGQEPMDDLMAGQRALAHGGNRFHDPARRAPERLRDIVGLAMGAAQPHRMHPHGQIACETEHRQILVTVNRRGTRHAVAFPPASPSYNAALQPTCPPSPRE